MQYIFTQYSIAMLKHCLSMHKVLYDTTILFVKTHKNKIYRLIFLNSLSILILLGFDYLDNRYNTMLYFIPDNSCLNSLTIKTSIESIKMHFFSIIACRHENKEKMHVSKRQNENP